MGFKSPAICSLELRHLRDIMRFCKSCDDWVFPASFGSHCLGVRRNGKKSKILYWIGEKEKLSEKSGPWDYRNRSIWEKYFPRGQMPSARQKRHQTVSMKLADCQDSCRVFDCIDISQRSGDRLRDGKINYGLRIAELPAYPTQR